MHSRLGAHCHQSTLVSIQRPPHPPRPPRSYWNKTSPTLATCTPLCLTMVRHSPLKNSKVGAVREALPTSQGHHTIPPPMALPNVWFRLLSRHSTKSSLPPRAALQEFLIQYRRTLRSEGYSPSELLNGHQIWTKIDVLLPYPAHAAQGKQAREATKSQAQEAPNRVASIYSVGTPCYALYCGPRLEKDPRWVPAVVTKVFGSRSVSVRVFPRGATWMRHIEQLCPRYGAQEDADPGEAQVSSTELVPPLEEDIADVSEFSVPTVEVTRDNAKPMRMYTGSDYSRDNPRRSARQHHRTGNFTSQ